MKICFIMPFFYKEKNKGAEIQTFLIAQNLALRGHQIYYLCEKMLPESKKQEVVEGVKVLRCLKYMKLFRFLNLFKLYLIVSKLQPEICYQRMASPYTGIVMIISKLINAKFIWACSEDATLQKYYLLHRKINDFKGYERNIIIKIILLLNTIIDQILISIGIKYADSCIAQNSLQYQLLQNNHKREAIIIRSGHKLRNHIIHKEKPAIILWMNSISKRKQPDLFIEIAKKCSELNCFFIMIGKASNKNYLSLILSRAEGLSHFKYINQISFEETPEWYDKSTIYINTTAGGEGFPNAFIQSWLSETPIISLETDPDDLIKNEGLGLLSGSIDQLKEDIILLLRHDELRISMAKKARTYAEKHFNISNIAFQYENLFNFLNS